MNASSSRAKKGLLNAVMTILLILVAMTALFFLFLEIDKHPDVSKSPGYTDLMAMPVYAKSGFDPATLFEGDMTMLTNVEAMGWETVLPGSYQGNYLVSNLLEPQEFDEHPLFSLTHVPEREFTFLIPFELDESDINAFHKVQPTVPGLFLSGIGDNWEIFVNGHLIASEIHLDENGQIIKHRSIRDVALPIHDEILHAGENYLVFRILASYDSVDAGLFYSSGYYLGDYTQIKMRSMNLLTIIFCSIYIFMGLYHLILFLMQRDKKYNLFYCLFTTLIGIYFLSRTAFIYHFVSNSEVAYYIEFGAFYFLPIMLAAFVEQLGHGRLFVQTKIFFGCAALFVLLQILLPIDFVGNILAIAQIFSVLMILYGVVFDGVAAFVWEIRAQKAALPAASRQTIGDLARAHLLGTPFGNMIIAIVFLGVTGIFDLFDALVLHTGIVLSKYCFFLFNACTAFILARNLAAAFNRINSMNENLETAVQMRTVELEEHVRIAELASHAKGDFLANMSHEIRTPITAIIGMTSIGRDAEGVSKKDYSFDKISDASNHLLGVINDILDMSKIEAGKLELSEVRFCFLEMIERVKDVIRVRSDEKDQNLAVILDDRIPKWLLGDDQRLAQVITNLLSNAVKFTPAKGDITLSAALESETDQSCVIRFEVRDTGIGISEEQQARLFSSFQQADKSTTRHYGGTGLGLALSKRIVEIMNGDITLTSKVGEGSTFAFAVEMRKEDEALAEAMALAAAEGALQKDEFDGFTILLAEDIEVNREIIMTLLEPGAMQFVCALNGSEAVELFRERIEDIDLILMDIQMPTMDGYMATRLIREMPEARAKQVPIVAMTANVFKEDVEHCLAAGMNAHVGKPIDVNEVTALLRRFLLNQTDDSEGEDS